MANTDFPFKPVLLADAGDIRFAPFGTCFELDPGSCRIPVPLAFEGEQLAGTAGLTIITAPSARRTERIDRLECHPFSVQTFIPLAPQPLVAILGSAGEPPGRADQLTAFIVPPGRGIAYRTGTWHCGLMGLRDDVPVLSFVRRLADGSDTEIADLPFSMRIEEFT